MGIYILHQPHKLDAGQAGDIHLHVAAVGECHRIPALDHVGETPRPVAVHPDAAQVVGVIVTGDPVVAVDHIAGARVQGMRHFLKGHFAGPLILVRPAGRWDHSLAPGAHRDLAGHPVADVALHVGIGEVQLGRFDATHRLDELIPVAGAIEAEPAVECRIGAEGHRLDCQSLGRLTDHIRDDRSVPGDGHRLDVRFGLAFDPNGLRDHLGLQPLTPDPVAPGIGCVEFLHEQVFAVRVGQGDAPCDMGIVAADYPRQSRQRDPGDLQVAGLQVNFVPGARHSQLQVHVIAQDRASRGAAAGSNCPRIAAHPPLQKWIPHTQQSLLC